LAAEIDARGVVMTRTVDPLDRVTDAANNRTYGYQDVHYFLTRGNDRRGRYVQPDPFSGSYDPLQFQSTNVYTGDSADSLASSDTTRRPTK